MKWELTVQSMEHHFSPSALSFSVVCRLQLQQPWKNIRGAQAVKFLLELNMNRIVLAKKTNVEWNTKAII